MVDKKTVVELVTVYEIEPGRVWGVPSSSKEGVVYRVTSDPEVGMKCNCPAGWNGINCRHRKSVLVIGKMKESGKVGEEQEKAARFTKGGYAVSAVTSAYQKEVRRGDEELALFFGMELYDVAFYYFWKRTLIIAAEDVGTGSPDTIVQVNALYQAWKTCKDQSGYYVDPQHAVMAILLLCRAKKSAEVDNAKNYTSLKKKSGYRPAIPEYALDCHTQAGKEAGKTEADWYAFREATNPSTDKYFEKLREFHPDWAKKRMEGI